MNYKVVGIRRPNYYDVVSNRDMSPVVVETEDASKLSGIISQLLFNDINHERVNYVLVRWGGKMYVCEPVDLENKQYEKSQIDYHPYQSLT